MISSSYTPFTPSASLNAQNFVGTETEILSAITGSFSGTTPAPSTSIQYTINSGEDISSQFYTPISSVIINRLIYSELDIKLIFKLVFSKIGPWRNYTSFDKYNSDAYQVTDSELSILLDLIKDIYEENGHEIHLTTIPDTNNKTGKNQSDNPTFKTDNYNITIPIPKNYHFTKDQKNILQTLDITPSSSQITFTRYKTSTSDNNIKIVTRSIGGMIRYLSTMVIEDQNIDISNNKKSVSAKNHTADSNYKTKVSLPTPISTNTISFKIYTSNVEPIDAYIKLIYNNKWYYIKRSDMQSKLVFSVAQQILAMSGKSTAGYPLLLQSTI